MTQGFNSNLISFKSYIVTKIFRLNALINVYPWYIQKPFIITKKVIKKLISWVYIKKPRNQNKDIDYYELIYKNYYEKKNISPSITREKFIKKANDALGRNTKVNGLEIGPYYCPVLKGDNVRYFDVFNQERLKENYLADKNLINNIGEKGINGIPKIDYTDENGSLVNIKEKFSAVFSSHNIEHQVNLVEHLKQLDNVLTEDGVVYLAIPDRRYCFDHFIPSTLISEVLAVYWESPKRHSLQTILSMKCETTHNNVISHWIGKSGKQKFLDDANAYKQAYLQYTSKEGYIDAHKWRFTPISFLVIVDVLNQLNLVNMEVSELYNTAENSAEFFAVLKKKIPDIVEENI